MLHPLQLTMIETMISKLLRVGCGVLSIWGGLQATAADRAANRYVSYPSVARPSEGIAWPRGQALPTFAAPAAKLDTIEVQALTTDEQLTFSALQGHVNRQQPRIYLLDAQSDAGRDTWANTATIGIESRQAYGPDDRYELLAKYAAEISGVVLYDPRSNPHYRNLASTVAGLKRAIPVTPTVLQNLQTHGIELEIVADLTKLDCSSPLEIYQHLYDQYWDQCEKRFLVSARPDDRGGDHHHTRDMAAACGTAVVWLDPRIPAEKKMLRRFFSDMEAGHAVVLGWYATERSGITTASEFGIGTLPADHYISATVYSGTDPQIQIPAVPAKPVLERKAYIAIFISDGDNIQYTQRAMRKIWDATRKERGQIPLNWTIAPGLVDIGPGILNYYYTTATAQDCFVTGPSGMGYAMPFNTLAEPGAPVGLYLADPARMDGYAKLTETYLQRSGLRVMTIWDDATPMQRDSYERHCRNLYGATVQNFKDVPAVAGSVEDRRLRFDKLVIPYAGTYEHIHRSLASELKAWDRSSAKFLAYQVDIWGELKPEKLIALERAFNQQHDGQIEFVRADHYFNLYNEAHGLPFNLCLSSQISVTAHDASGSAKRVIDGTPATRWTASQSNAPWLRFDLGADHQIHRYVIRHAGADAAQRAANTRDFTVQASEDGTAWRTIDIQRGNLASVSDVELPPFTTRYLKVIVDHPGADSIAQIAEVEWFGIAATDR